MKLPRATRSVLPAWAFAVLSVAVPVSTQVVAADDAAAEELERFAGTWQCVSGERRGDQLPPDFSTEIRMIFHGTRLTLHARGQETNFEIRIDPTPLPKVFVMTALDGKHKSKSARGIYEWAGEKLRLCIPNAPRDDQEPPKEFNTADDPDLILVVLEKVGENAEHAAPLGVETPRARRVRGMGRHLVQPLLIVVKNMPAHRTLTKYFSSSDCTEKQCLAEERP